LELPDDASRELLQNVFWIASASLPGVAAEGSNGWLKINANAFPDLWEFALLSPVIQDNEILFGKQTKLALHSRENTNDYRTNDRYHAA
jgi:hypothetical protein